MDAFVDVVVSKIVLVDHADKPMGAPSVFGHNGGPVSFVLQLTRGFLVLSYPKSLQLRSEALLGLDLPLGLQDMDVGIDNPLVVRRDGRGERVEIKVEIGVFHLP